MSLKSKFKTAGLAEKVDEAYLHEVQVYWFNRLKKVMPTDVHLALDNLGCRDLRFFPQDNKAFIPYLNSGYKAYSDKSLYDLLYPVDSAADTVLKRVKDNYYLFGEPIKRSEILRELGELGCDLIIKPSNTNNGYKLCKLYYDNGLRYNDKPLRLDDLEKDYDSNYIIQHVLDQHPFMKTIHPDSVNTLRIVTLRFKQKLHHLLTFMRAGSGGKCNDNAASGGIACGIDDEGRIIAPAFKKFEGNPVVYKHPTTNYDYTRGDIIPSYAECIAFALDLHRYDLHHNYISWDIAINPHGHPVFVEANYWGATWLYQLAARKPLFGDLTEDVTEYIRRVR